MKTLLYIINGLLGAVAGFFLILSLNAVTLMSGGNGLGSGPEFLSVVLISAVGGGWYMASLTPSIMMFFNKRADLIKSNHAYSQTRYREALNIAEKEVEANRQEQGLWSQALVDANGDEKQRKIKYMELRAKYLCNSERVSRSGNSDDR